MQTSNLPRQPSTDVLVLCWLTVTFPHFCAAKSTKLATKSNFGMSGFQRCACIKKSFFENAMKYLRISRHFTIVLLKVDFNLLLINSLIAAASAFKFSEPLEKKSERRVKSFNVATPGEY